MNIIKKKIKVLMLLIIFSSLTSCANMTAQDWRDIEQGLNQLNCSLYQTGC
jgi:hypothetical protein